MFTHPLDNIRVASPCPADWDQMFGDERKRFCSECKLNVYNLSGMTRGEAENLLVKAEGRLCVRYFKRADGTVLTKDCPVGAALKRRVSRVATASVSMVFAFASGLIGIRATEGLISLLPLGDVPAPVSSSLESDEMVPIAGEVVIEEEMLLGQVYFHPNHRK